MRPSVSIIITTRNRAEHLRETLVSFQRLQVPKELQAELVVVDNGSTDGTAEVIKANRLPQMPMRYLHEAQLGQSHARNTGMANTSGDVIMFTDDDVRVATNWIAGVTELILSGKADVVAGGVRIAPHLERPWMTATLRGSLADTARLGRPAPRDMVGANMAFSRKVLATVPRFDPELGPGALGFADDTLFCRQLLQAGFVLTTALRVCVEHHFDANRLSRKAWINFAVKSGASGAYLMHHWYHQIVPKPRFKYYLSLARLAYWRSKRFLDTCKGEGFTDWELEVTRSVAQSKFYLAEFRRPRNYAKRGLVKINGLKP